jgi:hypothetical protein
MPVPMRPLWQFFQWLVGAGLIVATAHSEETKPYQFKELRLSLPSSWLAHAQARVVPAQPLYSPEAARLLKEDPLRRRRPVYETMPQHLELRFGPLTIFPKEHAFHPEITVHPVADYARIFEPEDATKEMLRGFDEIWNTATDPAAVHLGKPLPFIPVSDGEQGVTVLHKPLSFVGGKGFRFITRFEIEASLLSDHGLVYVFEGLTNDRKTYVLATFPILLEGLPGADAKEHLGYSLRAYQKFEKEIDAYHDKASAWLVANQAKMEPNLKLLDEIVASIAIAAP